MRENNWEKVENIFHAALDVSSEERKSYLHKACAGDDELFSEVESLIKNLEKNSDFLNEPVLGIALGTLHKNGHKKLTGTSIGVYELHEKIGAGGMGEVYKAFDTKLERYVALKFLSKLIEDDPFAKRQFIREAQAAAALDHPNICTIYDFEQTEEYHFIVMQYIEGKTLSEFIEKENIGIEEFKNLARQIMTAVAFAHSNGIIHRDLKPGNIMLTTNREIKILDFGLAKVIHQKQTSNGAIKTKSNFSHNGLIIGTVSYMSPEQLRGEKVDHQSDIFSVGIILYELLAKENPFNRRSQAETIAAILGDEPFALKKHKPDFPTSLISLVEKCLEKDTDRRFQSATEILTELDSQGLENRRIKTSQFYKQIFTRISFIALILLSIFVGFYFYSNSNSKRRIAVLPITLDVVPEEKKYIAFSLTREIIDGLSNLSELDVKNESLVTRYQGKAVDPLSAGRELNADAVISGTISENAAGLILDIKIIRTLDGTVIDTYKSKIEEGNIIELPKNIVSHITDKMMPKLTEQDKNKLSKKDTDSIEAKDLYLRGRYYLKRKSGNDVEDAIQAFIKAKDIDQSFAKAWAGLADAYLSQAVPGVKGAISPDKAAELAKLAAKRAIDLDPTLCDSYNSLGLISSRYEWKWNEAETYFKIAIDRDPEFLPAHFGLIDVLINQRRFDEAMAEVQKIKEIDPFSVSSDIKMALIYYQNNEDEQTDRILADLLKRFSKERGVKYLLAYQFLKTGRLNEAVDILEPIYNSNNVDDKIVVAAPLGFAYAKMKRYDDALKVIKDLDKAGNDIYVPAQEKALIYAGVGDYDKVFELLKRSCREKFSSLPNWINEPLVPDEVKNDPRFAQIRKCVNL